MIAGCGGDGETPTAADPPPALAEALPRLERAGRDATAVSVRAVTGTGVEERPAIIVDEDGPDPVLLVSTRGGRADLRDPLVPSKVSEEGVRSNRSVPCRRVEAIGTSHPAIMEVLRVTRACRDGGGR